MFDENKQSFKIKKSRIALIKVELDLLSKGYSLFTTEVDYWLPFDAVAYNGEKFIKLQVKYSTKGHVVNKNAFRHKSGKIIQVQYKENDFDYYAIYLPSIDKVVYPSIKFGGKTISTTLPKGGRSLYWWEDFINFTDDADRKSYKDFNIKNIRAYKERIEERKVIWPSKEELSKLLWEMPTTDIAKKYGVSDKAVSKWAKIYELDKPSRGYWTKFKLGVVA